MIWCPVTRIAFWRNGLGFLYNGSISPGGDDGFYEDTDVVRSIRTKFRRDDLTNPVKSGIKLRGGQVRSDSLDRICPERRTRVSKWANGGWIEPDSHRPTNPQLMGRKRRAGDRLNARPDVDREVRHTENRWDTPHKRALFGLMSVCVIE